MLIFATAVDRLKRWLLFVLVLLLCVAAAFSAGRFTAPERVETREVDRWRTLDLTTTDLTRGFTFAREVKVTRWRDVVTTITDAGITIADKTIEHETSSESGTVTEELRRVEIVEVERERVVEKTVTVRPSWRVSILAGASLRDPLVPIAGPLVLGATVEGRIAQSPLSVGGWINTVGAAGVSFSGEF